MDIDDFQTELDAIDWAGLQGAYGASDGSNRTQTDIPAALAFLADLDPNWDPRNNVTVEQWNEALDVIHAHAVHQGSLYEISPHIVPFVMALVSRHCRQGRTDLVAEPPIEDDLAILPAILAQSAFRYRRHDAARDRGLARRVDEALAAETDRVLGWFDGDLRAVATFTCIYSEPLREPGFAQMRHLDLPYYAYVAMAQLDDPPEWALEQAEANLEAPGERDRLAAAALIACAGDVPEDLKSRLDEILRPGADAILNRQLEFSIPLQIPDVHPEFDGPLIESSVLVTRPERLVVQVPDVGNVSTRWCAPDIEKGDTVRIGLSPHENIRVVEWTNADGDTIRKEIEGR